MENNNGTLTNTSESNSELKDFVIEFAQYLNDSEYHITPQRISYAINEVKGQKQNQYEIILKPLFSSNKNQYVKFHTVYEQFLKNKIQHISLKKQQQDLVDEKNALQQKISGLDKMQTEELKNLPPPGEANIPKSKENLLQKEQKLLKEAIGKESTEMLLNRQYSKISNATYADILEHLLALAQNKLLKGKEAQYKLLTRMFDAVTEIQKAVNKAERSTDEVVKEIRAKYQRTRARLQKQLSETDKENQSIQEKINNLFTVHEADNTVTIKDNSSEHRQEFMGYKSVQQYGNININDESFAKNFDKLTETEKQKIKEFLKDNILHFKTKLARNLNIIEKQKIDMLKTIQYACKTGGMPIQLYYQEKKPSKTNLVLVLDISGSCKAASSMMLTFMHMLKTVFPKGTKAFVFVNSLYDISGLMDTNDIEKSISKIFAAIPTRGIYSNYFNPINQLWNEHRHEIKSDSIVIFMGDARNNSNKPGYDILKNICRKAKKAYWLNTEEYQKWDQKDSIASGYAKYAKMYEVINTNELAGFIQYGMK